MTRSDFAAAYEGGYRSTVRFLLSRGVPARAADDVAQAGWTRGWERRHQLKEAGKVVSWINRISLNLFRNRLRRQKPTEEAGDLACRPSVNAAVIDVERGLARCSAEDRRLIRSYYLEGYTSRELGRLERCKPGALRVRVLRAKKRFLGSLRRGR